MTTKEFIEKVGFSIDMRRPSRNAPPPKRPTTMPKKKA